jgi:hypothetical protein
MDSIHQRAAAVRATRPLVAVLVDERVARRATPQRVIEIDPVDRDFAHGACGVIDLVVEDTIAPRARKRTRTTAWSLDRSTIAEVLEVDALAVRSPAGWVKDRLDPALRAVASDPKMLAALGVFTQP